MANYKQMSLLSPGKVAEVHLREDHELVQITELLDWDELILMAMNCRSAKVKKETGPQPRYRELLGAVVLISVKGFDYRQAEDIIAHYVPARYLCDLMDSTWQPDHVTIFDFTTMLGPEGMDSINQVVLKHAQSLGFLDPSELMSDTTAQEAKQKTSKKIYHTVEAIQKELDQVFKEFQSRASKSSAEFQRLWEVMGILLPQIKHFIETGFVANKKIVHLKMSELYSIVRGKAGKKTEFGIKWGINRMGGGFVSGFVMDSCKHASDIKFCHQAVLEHMKTFGEAPETYGFDRGGYSKGNIKKMKKLDIKHIGIAPKGKADWEISKAKQKVVKPARAQVEGIIGTIKSNKYKFNKPGARSITAMESCGHRSILGFNLTKLMKENQNLLLQSM